MLKAFNWTEYTISFTRSFLSSTLMGSLHHSRQRSFPCCTKYLRLWRLRPTWTACYPSRVRTGERSHRWGTRRGCTRAGRGNRRSPWERCRGGRSRPGRREGRWRKQAGRSIGCDSWRWSKGRERAKRGPSWIAERCPNHSLKWTYRQRIGRMSRQRKRQRGQPFQRHQFPLNTPRREARWRHSVGEWWETHRTRWRECWPEWSMQRSEWALWSQCRTDTWIYLPLTWPWGFW